MSTLIARHADTLHRIPALGLAILVTDRTCHFGSFALESLVFLALWFLLDKLYQWGIRSRPS